MASSEDTYRRKLGGMTAAHNRVKAKCKRLESENAELRKLVRDMHWHIYNECGYFSFYESCFGCEHAVDGFCAMAAKFEERMAALGIEAE